MRGPPGSRAPRQPGRGGGASGSPVIAGGPVAGAAAGARGAVPGGALGGSGGLGGITGGAWGWLLLPGETGRARKATRLLLYSRLHRRWVLLHAVVGIAALLALLLFLRLVASLSNAAQGSAAERPGGLAQRGSRRIGGSGSQEGPDADAVGLGGSATGGGGGSGRGGAWGKARRDAELGRVALDVNSEGARRGRGTDVYEASREGEILNAWDGELGLEIDVWDPRTHNPLNKDLSDVGSEVHVQAGEKQHYITALILFPFILLSSLPPSSSPSSSPAPVIASNLSAFECRQWVEYCRYAGVSHVLWYHAVPPSPTATTPPAASEPLEAMVRAYEKGGFVTVYRTHSLFPDIDSHDTSGLRDQALLHALTHHGAHTTWLLPLTLLDYPFAPRDLKPGFLDRTVRSYEARRPAASQLLLQTFIFTGPSQQPPSSLVFERFVHRREQSEGVSLQPFAMMTPLVRPDSVVRLFWRHPHHMEMGTGHTMALPSALLRIHRFTAAAAASTAADATAPMAASAGAVVADSSMKPLADEVNQMLGRRRQAGQPRSQAKA